MTGCSAGWAKETEAEAANPLAPAPTARMLDEGRDRSDRDRVEVVNDMMLMSGEVFVLESIESEVGVEVDGEKRRR